MGGWKTKSLEDLIFSNLNHCNVEGNHQWDVLLIIKSKKTAYFAKQLGLENVKEMCMSS